VSAFLQKVKTKKSGFASQLGQRKGKDLQSGVFRRGQEEGMGLVGTGKNLRAAGYGVTNRSRWGKTVYGSRGYILRGGYRRKRRY